MALSRALLTFVIHLRSTLVVLDPGRLAFLIKFLGGIRYLKTSD